MIKSLSDFKCDEAEISEVVECLKRVPSGPFTVVVRNKVSKGAIVIMNYPLLNNGSPMPTLFWLIGKQEVKSVSRIEAQYGLKAIEQMFEAGKIREIHRKYFAMRDALMPVGYGGVGPTGGVGGTARGLKCLHAHLANFMATRDDDVGKWVFNICGFKEIDYESELM